MCKQKIEDIQQDEPNYTEIVEELIQIKEQISNTAKRLDEIARTFGYNGWVYNVMTGYVTPYLRGTIGEDRTIMMNLQNIIDRIEDMSEIYDEDEDYDDEDVIYKEDEIDD